MEVGEVIYQENYKTMRDINKGLNKWPRTPCIWIGRLNIVMMSTLSKCIYKPLVGVEWKSWFSIGKCKGPLVTKALLKKEKTLYKFLYDN